jgi:hypothetical protein
VALSALRDPPVRRGLQGRRAQRVGWVQRGQPGRRVRTELPGPLAPRDRPV